MSVFFICLVLSLAIGCGPVRSEGGAFVRAEDFNLKDIDGNDVRLSDYSGKVILLNFFATWCPPCRGEMPDFNQVFKDYGRNVVVVAVCVGNEGVPELKAFAEKNKLEFPILVDDGTAAGIYGPIRAIPVTIVIDRYFNVVKKYIGAVSKKTMVKDIEELLGEWSAK